MIEALANAELALRTHQKHIDMISNNVSNINTPGYKASTPVFTNLIAAPEATGVNQPGVKAGSGVEISDALYRFTDGEFKHTGSPLDLAIQGNGLIEVELSNGDVAYTRVMSLRKLEDGSLATVHGHRLASNIIVPPDVSELKVARDGIVSGLIRGDSEALELGQIELAVFDSFEALSPGEGGIWHRTEEAGQLHYVLPYSDGAGAILQGYTEMSNVNMIEEMVSLMSAQRAYQLNSRVIQTSDQILETINNLTR
ncbi:TPA: flagellar hook-basal body protein [Vibrio cholerae]|uniref:flagellar hook-basal body protein n=1 Tax=Vibrio cholerae TaxID=666 RepID=UPI0004E45310|nr:flagellar hook-basal body protein [Vibrio cholerae]EGQ8315814.1 flagellar hook-basal body complex protein [Vibrio cholerae]EGQ9391518.1 flagellar hook-basal body protein [Vibrio cholerae]EGR0538775.1 flagellar hook-basal body protein [Vibrio cholerae]EGR1860457.1 flagellar hook-basal body protein [Vibrio cholerae]EGR2311433.1 flagellar hook-basal body protein [Vibrio cholerae]